MTMADPTITVILDVKHGPALSACVDVLNMVNAVADLIPDHHVQDRDELLARAEAIGELLHRTLTITPGGGS